MYPFIFSEERIRLAEEQVEKVLTLVGFQPETVLDLCCGPGRHAIILAQRGIQVTGVDREGPEDDLRVLRNAYQSLKPGGAILMDLRSKELVAAKLQPTISTELTDGALLIQRHEVIEDWRRMHNEWILIKDERARSFEFRHRLYSDQEMKDLLRKAGFDEVALFGGLDGNEYRSQASHLVAFGRRRLDQ